MPSWKEILGDKTAYADDFVIQLSNGQTVKLGDARAYDKENEGALLGKLTAKERELAEKEQKVNLASATIGDLYENYKRVTGLTDDEVLSGKQPTRREVARSSGLDESDPLVGDLVKEMKQLRQLSERQGQELDKLKNGALKPMLNTYLNDYYETSWEKVSAKLPKGARESLKFESVLKHAEENKLIDKSGRLDLGRAAKEMSFDYLVDERVQENLVTERQRQQDAATMASIQPPVSGSSPRFGPAQNFKNSQGFTKSFDEVLSDAARDSELWTGIARGTA